MDDDNQRSLGGNTTTHDPLPYVVRLRVTHGDDAPPETREIKTVAYSALEAVMQAHMEAAGSSVIDESRVVVEWIGPDEPDYWLRMLQNSARQLAILARRRASGGTVGEGEI